MNFWLNRRSERAQKVHDDLVAFLEQVRRYLAVDLNKIQGPRRRYLRVTIRYRRPDEA